METGNGNRATLDTGNWSERTGLVRRNYGGDPAEGGDTCWSEADLSAGIMAEIPIYRGY